MSDWLLEVRDLTKEFSGTTVLRGITLGFRRGEVHGLLGENGAGKSTLIKILTGVYGATGGEILLEGAPVRINNPLDAHRLGLGAVYQDTELIAGFSVGENILLGNEPGGAMISSARIQAQAQAILDEIGIAIDAARPARSLSAAEAQLVTLGTLFHRKYKVIILDEPTARLSAPEVELLFRIIQNFRAQGITIIYISHRLEEIKRICDRATILRGGAVSATLDRDEITEERVTELMVDRSRAELEVSNTADSTGRPVVLDLDGLTTAKLAPLTTTVRAGEVLGITGPVGGGMEQVELALGGILPSGGRVRVDGREVTLGSPPAARRARIAVIPEDRRRQALFPNLSVAENIALPVLARLSRLGLIRGARAQAYAAAVMDQLNVNPRTPHRQVRFFSGGNQQKAVIGKWLKAEARVYVFVEPTSGVDVGAIREIYDIILRLADSGAAVIVITSSTREILSLAERVMVIRNGVVVHEAPKSECNHDQLLALSMGGRGTKTAA
ncbi:sugar ABC transporter ATP-binding protein [Ruixingdingia sedimenti]|uniref:Sugar ABC transporter ATP-binding protein n=1 Tax=Ruixingdingia sedimenti TaxID=3073604 RepID=A0ABU1F439_9RHOB|nr:sugar ABC transporter ATP-binding protein [Xinfangfangia sp. LG-4]MDR5651622.1 sugar ABC transporter ATP-binding protein [Xinfangfangia sp. LG-4]